MSILDSIVQADAGQFCDCLFCGSSQAKKELPHGGYYQLFCPNCGRYGIGHYATGNVDCMEVLEQSQEFRSKIGIQLRNRKNLHSVIVLTTDVFRTGLLSLSD